MRIFETNKLCNSINFVDENNVLVGFDNDAECCETFGYEITFADGSDIEFELKYEDDFLGQYVFDPDFISTVKCAEDGDCGGSIRFRLIAPDKPDLFLKLYNYHSGYYSHGFTMRVGDKIAQNGYL